jgi:protoporphyrinogen oxidase
MWGPLLKCKLGAYREEASAAFIWATITRLYSTREKNSSQQECLGYVQGGYRVVFQRLIESVKDMGGRIFTDARVTGIAKKDDMIEIEVDGEKHGFEIAIATMPGKPLAAITPELSSNYARKLKEVKYLGIVCIALVLKRRISPFYVTNLANEDFPFTGIIEMTNLISTEETAGHHLVYLPKYTSPSDPLFEANDEEVWAQFRPHVQRVIPDFEDSDVERRFTFRERLVQPVPTLHYSRLVPEMETGIEGLILANTTQIINSTLNNNAMVKIARRAVEAALKPSMSKCVTAAEEPATVA